MVLSKLLKRFYVKTSPLKYSYLSICDILGYMLYMLLLSTALIIILIHYNLWFLGMIFLYDIPINKKYKLSHVKHE